MAVANAVKKSLRCRCLLGAGHPITLDRYGPPVPEPYREAPAWAGSALRKVSCGLNAAGKWGSHP
jgi:hypothetical protein